MPPPPPLGPPPWSPPPGPRPNVPAPGPPGPPPATGSFFCPKPNVLLSLRLKVNRPGPVAKLMGIGACPACGSVLKQPNAVCNTLDGALEPQVANAGRVLNCASPKTSWPVVMLNGIP